ncbi:MAG: DUF1643 domain-containing protein [Ignavibacteriales bacterium]|nr:DUF1643 domain-containing protein [Ignavibacteriales bacterium]
MNNLITLYSDFDENYRFLIGKPGKETLFFIAMNPSVATINKWDQTILKSFGLAKILGYDGCIVLNLLPSRQSKSSEIPLSLPASVLKMNIDKIIEIIERNEKDKISIVACWGEKFCENTDMQYSLITILEKIDKLKKKIDWYCLKDTKSGNVLTNGGHPRHLSYLKETTFPEPFNILDYINRIKLPR